MIGYATMEIEIILILKGEKDKGEKDTKNFYLFLL